MLPRIPELHFDEESHRYQYDGKWLPLSPTQVLSFDLDDEAKQRIEETKHGPDGWELRGNTVHSYLEQLLLGAALLDAKEFQPWCEPLKDCWLFEGATILGVELRMSDKKRIGGSCDFLVKKPDGTVVLGDLKTVSSLKALKARKPATAQLGCIPISIEQELPEAAGRSLRDACCRSRQVPCDHRRPTECWLAWESAMSRYQAHQDLRWASKWTAGIAGSSTTRRWIRQAGRKR